MKVNNFIKCETTANNPSQPASCHLKPVCDEIKKTETSAQECCCSYGLAQVLMQNGYNQLKPQTKEDVEKILTKIFEDTGMEIGRYINDKYIHIGRPVEGLKGLCYDDVRARCIRDKKGFVSSIYTLDMKTGAVKIYDAQAKLKYYFTPEEMKALKEYKYTVQELHNFLRHGRVRGINTRESLNNLVNTIDSLFNNDQKVLCTTKDIVLYRALQPDLTEKEKDILTTKGAVFTEKSYVSTSTDYSVAERFRTKDNPILKIDIPAGTKYIDLDALFNIDRQHWNEKEYLLNRNSHFEVTGFDVLNNVINVKYLGDN